MTPFDAAAAADTFDFVRSKMSWKSGVVFDLMVEGHSATEVARRVNVPRHRATSLMRRVRKAARAALLVESLD